MSVGRLRQRNAGTAFSHVCWVGLLHHDLENQWDRLSLLHSASCGVASYLDSVRDSVEYRPRSKAGGALIFSALRNAIDFRGPGARLHAPIFLERQSAPVPHAAKNRAT